MARITIVRNDWIGMWDVHCSCGRLDRFRSSHARAIRLASHHLAKAHPHPSGCACHDRAIDHAFDDDQDQYVIPTKQGEPA